MLRKLLCLLVVLSVLLTLPACGRKGNSSAGSTSTQTAPSQTNPTEGDRGRTNKSHHDSHRVYDPSGCQTRSQAGNGNGATGNSTKTHRTQAYGACSHGTHRANPHSATCAGAGSNPYLWSHPTVPNGVLPIQPNDDNGKAGVQQAGIGAGKSAK